MVRQRATPNGEYKKLRSYILITLLYAATRGAKLQENQRRRTVKRCRSVYWANQLQQQAS